MEPACVIATVGGDAYRALIDWRDEADLSVLRAQLAQRGKARVVGLRGERVFTDIGELPGPGEAQPFYGTFGGGYEFWFLHTPAGWMLRVENCAHRSIRFGLSAALPPILIDDTSAVSVQLRRAPPEGVSWSGPAGLEDRYSEPGADKAIFSIDGEMYERLLAAGWAPARATAYRYLFVPLSVGCEIVAEEAASGARTHLTRDVGW